MSNIEKVWDFTLEEIAEVKEILDAKYVELLNAKGVILIPCSDSRRRALFYQLSKEYPNMVVFRVGEDEQKAIVLKYREILENRPNYLSLIHKMNTVYSCGNYEDCIAYGQQLLNLPKNEAFVFAQMGFAYIKLGEFDKAITYLTIATLTNVTSSHQGFDFTELINLIKSGRYSDGSFDGFLRRPWAKVELPTTAKEPKCQKEILQNLSQITDYILTSGFDIDTACEKLGMTPEGIDILKLTYAQMYYSQEAYAHGDALLRDFEHSQNKTPYTICLLAEIRRNKHFLANSLKPGTPKLALGLKSRKIPNHN